MLAHLSNPAMIPVWSGMGAACLALLNWALARKKDEAQIADGHLKTVLAANGELIRTLTDQVARLEVRIRELETQLASYQRQNNEQYNRIDALERERIELLRKVTDEGMSRIGVRPAPPAVGAADVVRPTPAG